MRTIPLSTLKKELALRSTKELADICIRLAKYKKENKELLTYILFDSLDEAAYIIEAKKEIDEIFEAMNQRAMFLIKKTLRKIQKRIKAYAKYSGKKETEVELSMYFCSILKSSGLVSRWNNALLPFFEREINRIETAIAALHEDLQYDYLQELKVLVNGGV